MSDNHSGATKVLYLVSCASRPAQRIQEFVPLAQAQGWEVCVIATPQATKFVDIPLLEQLTGRPVRSEYKRPEEPDVLPRADALVVFPATVNTLSDDSPRIHPGASRCRAPRHLVQWRRVEC